MGNAGPGSRGGNSAPDPLGTPRTMSPGPGRSARGGFRRRGAVSAGAERDAARRGAVVREVAPDERGDDAHRAGVVVDAPAAVGGARRPRCRGPRPSTSAMRKAGALEERTDVGARPRQPDWGGDDRQP
jgi:hypothetical protein